MSSSNHSENLPPYLTEEILLKSLEKKSGCKLEIVDIQSKVPDLKGGHFVSAVNTISVTIKNPETGKIEKVPIFIKTGTPDENRKELMDTMLPTYKEVMFFNLILPTLRKFCETESDGKIILDKYPYCFYAEHNEYDPIVLEDISHQGFELNNPKRDHDVETIKLVLGYMATFHAVSNHYLRKTKDAIVTENSFLSFNIFAPEMEQVFGDVFIEMYEQSCLVLKTPEHMEKYDLLIQMKKNLFKNLRSITEPEDPFNVLCMGDCWNNNMMFKYGKNGEVLDFKFLDFQLVRHDTLIYDMAYYLLTSTDHTTWKTHLSSYLQHYYETFNDVITTFKGVESCPFTYEEFEKLFYLRVPLAYPMMCSILCIRHLSSDEFTDPSDSNKGGDVMSEFKKAIVTMINGKETNKVFVDRVISAYDVVKTGVEAIVGK